MKFHLNHKLLVIRTYFLSTPAGVLRSPLCIQSATRSLCRVRFLLSCDFKEISMSFLSSAVSLGHPELHSGLIRLLDKHREDKGSRMTQCTVDIRYCATVGAKQKFCNNQLSHRVILSFWILSKCLWLTVHV